MGIHLPFIGYTRARGVLNVDRHEPELGPNRRHRARVRNFLAEMSRLPDLALANAVSNFDSLKRGNYFDELVFEKDALRRPELRKFLKREGPKTLVISAWDDLFEREASNDVVVELVEHVLEGLVPVVCIQDKPHKFNLENLRLTPQRFIHAIMDNAINFSDSNARPPGSSHQ